MTTSAGTTIHVDRSEVRHGHRPGTDGYSALQFGKPGQGAYASIFFHDTTTIDAVIAELVALRNEMEPYAAVITDSARTCQAKHPETGDWCVIEGPHTLNHSDCYGQPWTTPERETAGSVA